MRISVRSGEKAMACEMHDKESDEGEVKSCPHCGKEGLDFDMPGSPKPCRSPVVYDPGVGGWVCSYSQGKEIAVLQSTRE